MAKTSKTELCAVEGCTKFRRNRGWCSAHYERWRKYGSPTGAKWESVEQRFWTKVDKSADSDGCWIWTGTLNTATGYGLISVNYRHCQAHRYSYELATGEKLGRLHIDHLCFNRRCVNPDHLRAVTQQQNNEHKRGAQRNSKSGVRGVIQSPSGRWVAQVEKGRKNYHVGTFDTIEQAAEAARLKRCELFTHNDPDRLAG